MSRQISNFTEYDSNDILSLVELIWTTLDLRVQRVMEVAAPLLQTTRRHVGIVVTNPVSPVPETWARRVIEVRHYAPTAATVEQFGKDQGPGPFVRLSQCPIPEHTTLLQLVRPSRAATMCADLERLAQVGRLQERLHAEGVAQLALRLAMLRLTHSASVTSSFHYARTLASHRPTVWAWFKDFLAEHQMRVRIGPARTPDELRREERRLRLLALREKVELDLFSLKTDQAKLGDRLAQDWKRVEGMKRSEAELRAKKAQLGRILRTTKRQLAELQQEG